MLGCISKVAERKQQKMPTDLVVCHVECELLAVLETRVETAAHGLARAAEVSLRDRVGSRAASIGI